MEFVPGASRFSPDNRNNLPYLPDKVMNVSRMNLAFCSYKEHNSCLDSVGKKYASSTVVGLATSLYRFYRVVFRIVIYRIRTFISIPGRRLFICENGKSVYGLPYSRLRANPFCQP